MRRRHLTVRTIALLGAGSAAIHQLRYAIGYGDRSSAALAAHPHGYLDAVLPGIATALVIAFAALLLRAAGGRRPARPTPQSLQRVWVACALALAAIYATQETIEGSGAFAHGGWIGLALALPVGLLVAAAIRGAAVAEAMPASVQLFVVSIAAVRRTFVRLVAASSAVVGQAAARGPPSPFVV